VVDGYSLGDIQSWNLRFDDKGLCIDDSARKIRQGGFSCPPLADMPMSTPLTHLTMEELLTGFDVDIFPATLIAYGAAGGFWILLQPQGVSQVRRA